MAEIATLLLSYPGADPNVRYTNPSNAWRWTSNATPLHSAAAALSDNGAATQVLLAQGADVNARTSDGSTPLDLAAASHGIETMKALLAHGADINAARYSVGRFDDGWTPLHSTVTWHGDPVAAALSLTYPDIDVNAGNDVGNTTLHYAVTNNQGALVQVLLSHRDINPNARTRNDKQTPLHKAVYKENLNMVERLLDHPDTNPDRKNSSGETALWIAVTLDLYDIAEALLDHPDTDPSLLAVNGWTPLAKAVARGNSRMVDLLEYYGAQP